MDRKSLYVRLIHLPFGHDAERMVHAFAPVRATIPVGARLTLTWDQGAEMARHDLLDEHFAEGIYFTPPVSPWLRGRNENTNGLLGQYLRKAATSPAIRRRCSQPWRSGSTIDRGATSAGARRHRCSSSPWHDDPVRCCDRPGIQA